MSYVTYAVSLSIITPFLSKITPNTYFYHVMFASVNKEMHNVQASEPARHAGQMYEASENVQGT